MAKVKSNIAKWDTKFNELVAYKDAHRGSCNVPTRGYAENPQLGTWVNYQRTQYKKFQQDPATSYMTQERIERLESIAFQWGVTLSAEWDMKFNELVAYKDTHGGSCNVPKGYAENPQLGNWVGTQRKQYKKFQQHPSTSSMTQERIERLESIAFQWNGRSLTLNACSSEEDDSYDEEEEDEVEEEEEEEEEEEGKEEKNALSDSMKSRLNAELTHTKRVICKEQQQEAKKRRVKDT